METSTVINYRLVDDIGNEPKQILKPITDYKRESFVSLEEICKSLEDILDHELKRNIIIAKMNSEYDLTQDESASIHLYSMKWNICKN
ncbi:hypothetical protein I4U23_013288 [Adineta vaga]|nr:hypothetical protein I4U23_013288 [Adineta vaga]